MNYSPYNKEYFEYYGNNGPYDRNKKEWLVFFGKVADWIKAEINPGKVLEVGCAKGFLVESLRDRGIDAWGIDISEYAISQVRADIKGFCSLMSATEPFQDNFDLIICMEVLEHLTEIEGEETIRNICLHTKDVIFSSSPNHYHPDPTHQNIRQKEYWIRLFAENGFVLDKSFDASLIGLHAMRFKKKSFDITFISPGVSISGGIKVILEYCNRFASLGHHVNLIILAHKDIDWFDINPMVNIIHSSYNPVNFNKDVPDTDIMIATWWETAPLVAQYPTEKVRKFYLIQGYESLVFSMPEYANYTYCLPLKKIAVSNWLKTNIEDITREEVELIHPGIDHTQFHPIKGYRDKYPKDWIRIGMIFSSDKFKGFNDGLEALGRVKKKYPETKIILMGRELPGTDVNYDEFYESPPQEEIRNFYNSLDIFVSSSKLEGFYLPGLEAMACGTVVVATDSGGNRDYAIHYQTALVSPQGFPDLLAQNILKVIENKELAETLRTNASKMAKGFTWEKAVKKMLRLFVESESYIRANDPRLIGFLIDEITQVKQQIRQRDKQLQEKDEEIIRLEEQINHLRAFVNKVKNTHIYKIYLSFVKPIIMKTTNKG